MLSDAQIIEASRLFAVLAEPTRVRIIKHLMSGPLTVGELVEKLGMKQGSVKGRPLQKENPSCALAYRYIAM